MKKNITPSIPLNLTFLFVVLFALNGFSDNWTENFDSGLAASYTTGNQALTTGTWYTTSVYPEASSASYSGAHAARINDDTNGAGLITPSLNTCGTISFWYRELNSGGGTFEILKSYDNSNWTSITTQAYSGATYTQFSFDINDNTNGIYIKVLSDDNPGHLIIDDFKVTDYVVSGPELQTQIPTGTDVACGSTYDFGTQTTGTNTNQTLTIKNIGSADLNISSYPLSGTDATEFSISPASTNPTISAGSSYDVTVTFSPTTTGTKSAKITITSDDSDEGTCEINLIGNAVDPCATPTAQPTGLDLTSNTTTSSIDGTFTAASPTSDSYLVVYSTSSTLSSNPVDGTSYSPGDALGGGIVVDNISGTSFTASGLTSGTEYYFFIFANNNASCSGGPKYNTTSPLSDHEIAIPDTVNWTTPGCISNSTIDLNWDAAPGNSTGYLLVVRSGAVPHTITSLDPTTNLGESLDYSAATQFGSTTEYSRVLYKGTATSVSATNLPTTSCTFKIYTYTIGANGTDYVYSSGTQQTNSIELDNVSSEGSSCGDTQSSISWVNPTSSCFDEVMVVANETSGIDFTPSGDGSSYSANTVYSSVDQVIYKGTGTNVTVTGLSNGTTYYFEIFTRKGTEWSAGVEVSCTPNEITVLYPGDLAIVTVNTNITGSGDDEVCFFSFKDITNGTAIDFTDNGYERVTAGEWGDTEGTIRLERNGNTIEKGTVICVQGHRHSSSDFTVFVCGTNDNSSWNVSSLNGNYDYDLNVNDQIWIMQDGNWSNPSGNQNATYDGNVLFGWTATGWKPAPGYDDTKGSTLYDGAECFNTDVAATSNEDKVKFSSDTSQTLSQAAWIGEINSESNWTGYADNSAYNSGGFDYSGSCVKFKIDNSLGNGAGRWEGGEDNNWFNCANWLNMQVPDENIDVTILSNAHHEANIDDTQEDASTYGPIAKCKNLTIQDGGDTVYVQIDDANDELQVKENLTLENSSELINENGGTLTVDGNITINEDAFIDLDSNATDGLINIKGNWINNITTENDTVGLSKNGGEVVFMGTTQQTITDATSNETFFNLKMNNSSGLDLNGNDITILGNLDLTLGDITTSNDTVIVKNTDVASIANYSTASYVNGNLRRSVNTAGSYNLPVGTSAQYEIANINLNSSSGINSFNANFTEHPGSAALVDGGGVPLNLTINGTTLSEMLDYGFWTIKPDASSYSVNYDITLTSRGHTNGGSDSAQHTIVKRDDASDDWAAYQANHDNSTQSGTGTNPITAKLSGLLAFSDFAIAKDAQFPLPIKLIYFTAKKTKKGILLKWATASEINNDLFILEKSNRDMNFENLSIITGSGNSNSIIEYEYLDKTPTSGLNYYKLIQQDFNGERTDEGIVSSSYETKINYRIVNDQLEISSIKTTDAVTIDVYNSIGQKVKTINTIESNKIIVDLSDLPGKVIYLIKIKTSDNESLIKYFK